MIICKSKTAIDKEILRSLNLSEDAMPGQEVSIPDEALWHHGIYDEQTFDEKLGALFERTGGGE